MHIYTYTSYTCIHVYTMHTNLDMLDEGAECGTLAAPAVYVAFMAAMSLTAETQPAQDPGLSLLSDNK